MAAFRSLSADVAVAVAARLEGAVEDVEAAAVASVGAVAEDVVDAALGGG
jgi:hypothetical protein